MGALYERTPRDAGGLSLLHGVRVLVAPPSTPVSSGSVDGMARLVLRADEDVDAWEKGFTEESRRQIRVTKAANEERRALEGAAAAALQVRLVTGESESLLRAPKYVALLRRIGEHRRPGLAFPELSVLFWADETTLSPRQDTLYSSYTADVTQIIREIDALPISEIQKALRVQSVLDEQESQARMFTKRRLRLAGLLKSPTISIDQSRACQQKLSVAGNGIVTNAHGLYIRIDSCFAMEEDGTMSVAWNCHV